MASNLHNRSYSGSREGKPVASTPIQAHNEHEHPTLQAYVRIAIILAIITGVEVAIYYIPAFQGVLVPLLVALSAIKFVMVLGYFMHLKFDDHMLAGIFAFALVISIIVFVGLWAITHFDFASVFNANMSVLPDKPMLD